MRVIALFMLTLAMAGGMAAAQTSAGSSEQNSWSLDASAYTYIVPDSENYVQPTVVAIATGCTSRRASTTRIATRGPSGWATTSASAKRSRWRSRR